MKSTHIAFAGLLGATVALGGCMEAGSRPTSSPPTYGSSTNGNSTYGDSSYGSTPYAGTTYGVVEAIDVTQGGVEGIAGTGIGVGSILGGVVGGVLGHQVGGGKGKDVATVAGLVGGAVAGHEIEKRTSQSESYQVRVRLDRGGYQVLAPQSISDLHVGDRVRVDGEQVSRY
jgi:outer membrane lipoprotein SlyB